MYIKPCLTLFEVKQSIITCKIVQVVPIECRMQTMTELTWPFIINPSSYIWIICNLFRYMSILHPLTPRLTTRHTLLVIVVIWSLSLVLCSPDMALIQYESNITSGAQCFVCKWKYFNQICKVQFSCSTDFCLINLCFMNIIKWTWIMLFAFYRE